MEMIARKALIQTAPNAVRFRTLGTDVELLVIDRAELETIAEHVLRVFDEVDRTFSRFRSDSELARFDWLPGMRQPASPLFLELLDLAVRAARETDGWFDPTIRDALEAAGYDRSIERIEAEGPGPSRPASNAGRWDEIMYDRERHWVCVPEGVRLDFGGIGKGFAVDLALRALASDHGGVLLNAGGDLAVRGPVPDGGWRIDISADARTPVEATVALQAGALATSGLGRRSWLRDGARLHHLIDPRTGEPGMSPWRGVTVAARECTAAEVAAKTAWLMGDRGPEWLAGIGLAGRFAGVNGRVEMVGNWPDPTRKNGSIDD
jgi:thiamine biosynthesis lipoprotein